MPEKRINDAKIRAVANTVEILCGVLQSRVKDLQQCFNDLHDEAHLADPADSEFDKFLLELARVKMALDNLWGLRYRAKAMLTYGLPIRPPAPAMPERQPLLPALDPVAALVQNSSVISV